jgi:cytochrome c oxidase assembly protein subunit 15
VFGAYTRLSDSGLGCPDWPGCYGQASPLGAQPAIQAAQQAQPDGPVTWTKAWIEMVHRYLAMTVGVLILVIATFSWRERRRLPITLAWPLLTLLWVVVQGLFGRYTVTLRLHPAVVTMHLLGGLLLLGLLTVQREAFRHRPLALAGRWRAGAGAVLALLALQAALGGWVSANYAVIACVGFPLCNGSAWPAMDYASGFTLLRDLGRAADGSALPFEALVAIQMAHRVVAIPVLAAGATLAATLYRQPDVQLRRVGQALALLLLVQAATGVANVVFGWPLLAALVHSAGAAAMVLVLSSLLARARPGPLRGLAPTLA